MAAVVHQNSPSSRAERINTGLEESIRIYERVISNSPRLHTKQGRDLVAHSETELSNTLGYVRSLGLACGTQLVSSVRARASKLKKAIQDAPWYQRIIPGFFQEGLTEAEAATDIIQEDSLVSTIPDSNG